MPLVQQFHARHIAWQEIQAPLDASQDAIRAVADWIPSSRISPHCFIQLFAGQAHKWEVHTSD